MTNPTKAELFASACNPRPEIPDISVIVVTYNQEDTIARTLDSILAQETDAFFEIIVNDDHSTDSTAAIVRRYAETYPDIVRLKIQEMNLGVQGNYFDAVRRARARLIADCAGDDYWIDPLKLEKQWNVFRRNPDVSLVHTAWEARNASGQTVPFRKASREEISTLIDSRDIIKALITSSNGILIHLCTALYLRDPVIKALDNDPDLLLNPAYGLEDLQIMVLCANSGRIAYLPDVTLAYTTGASSISSQENPDKAFIFNFGSFRLRLHLAHKFDLENVPEMKAYIKRLTGYLAAMASRAQNRNLLYSFRKFVWKHRLPLSFKAFIHLTLGR